MKKRHWKRETKYLYPFILRRNGYIVDIKEAISYYEKYADLCEDIRTDKNCPESIKKSVDGINIRMPKYLQWAKERLVNKGK